MFLCNFDPRDWLFQLICNVLAYIPLLWSRDCMPLALPFLRQEPNTASHPQP